MRVRLTWWLALAVFAGALLFGHHTHAADAYPTVKEIEGGLGLSPGVELPRMVPARGRGWHAYFISARALGKGYYDVRVRLR